MSNYEVGQILYLTNEKAFKIIPIQVVEEVVRTTISGKIKTYLVQFPNREKTVVDINDIKFKCFKTEKEVRDYLLENTRSAIDALIKVANDLKHEAYSSSLNVISNDDNVVQQEEDSDIINVDLGHGQIGKLKVEDLTKVDKGQI